MAVLTAVGLLAACTDDPILEPRVERTSSPPLVETGRPAGGVLVARPPAGTRWQGVNGVVVAVPRGWSTSSGPCRPAQAAVWMVSGVTQPIPCPLVRAQGSVLQIGTRDLGPLRHRTRVGRFVLRHSGVRCEMTASGPCTLGFAIPSLRASFQIFYVGPSPAAFVQRMMRSVTLLEPGLTTVPAIPYGVSVRHATDRLQRAGLAAQSPAVDFPHYVTGTVPPAGRLVATGGTVRLTVGDG